MKTLTELETIFRKSIQSKIDAGYKLTRELYMRPKDFGTTCCCLVGSAFADWEDYACNGSGSPEAVIARRINAKKFQVNEIEAGFCGWTHFDPSSEYYQLGQRLATEFNAHFK